MRSSIKHFIGIIFLAVFGVATYYSQFVSPQLVIFFGFILAYATAVFVLFWILGRYGA